MKLPEQLMPPSKCPACDAPYCGQGWVRDGGYPDSPIMSVRRKYECGAELAMTQYDSFDPTVSREVMAGCRDSTMREWVGPAAKPEAQEE